MSGDDIRRITRIVGDDRLYRHFMRRINREFGLADEERNSKVYVLYQEDGLGEEIGFAVIGHSPVKMKAWEQAFKDEGWVEEGFAMKLPVFELMYMYIKPEFRGRGWGKKLFEKVVDYSKDRGIKSIYTYVSDRTPQALEFYKHQGARIIHDFSDGEVWTTFLSFLLPTSEVS